MMNSGRRWRLIDPAFQPSDKQGRIELALVLWAESAIDACDRGCRWFADHPLRSFVIWSLWLSLLYFALGPASYVKVPDCGNGTLPARMIAAQDFLGGRLGNWMAFSGCGTDRVLNNFRLEPHCILLAVLPPWLGYGLIMLLQRFVAGYFSFLVTRDDLQFTPVAAMLTGAAYSLFYQIGIHWQWDGFTLYDGLGTPALPLLLWLANRLTEKRWLLALPGGAAMGVALALSAPYFQTLFFPFLAVFWYTCIQPAWTWKRLLVLTCVFAGWAGVMAPEMLAAAKYLPLSHRQEIVVRTGSPFVKYIENVERWPETVWKNNQGYLAVALIALACTRLRDRRTLLTCLAVLGILSFVSHYHFFNDYLFSRLGILSSFHFHRFIYLVPFLCALALGLGLTAIPHDSDVSLSNRLTAVRLKLTEVLPSIIWLLLLLASLNVNLDRWKQLWRGENFTTLYRHPDLLDLADRRQKESPFRVACISDLWRPKLGMKESHDWSVSPGVAWAYGLETTDGYQVLYSLRYKEYWSEVLQPLLCADGMRCVQHIYWGNMLFLWHPSDGEMYSTAGDAYNLNLLSLANTKYLISPVALDDPELRLLPSNHRDQFEQWAKRGTTDRVLAALRGEWSHRPLYIYENRRCLPRFFVANKVQLYDNAQTLRYDLSKRPIDWLRSTVAVCREDLPADVDLEQLNDNTFAACDTAAGEVELVSQTSDRLELQFAATQPCVLFLSNTYHPGWRAELDGVPAELFAANHAFQAVFIPAAGSHRLVMSYHARY